MTKQKADKSKADKHIPVSNRPAVSVAALSSAKATDDDSLPDLSAPDESSDDDLSGLTNTVDTAETSTVSADDPNLGLQLPEEAVMFVYEPKCLECSHLVAFAEKTHNGCHFTAGNEDCPAQSITISVKLPMTNILRNFLRAEEEGDTEKLGRLYATLSTKPSWAQKQILDALQDARERALVK